MEERITIGSDIEFVRYLKQHGGDTMKKCFQCATCSVACALSPKELAFPRKEMIQASWGLKDKLINDPDIWLCHGCMDCSQQCPRGAKPADLMSALRAFVYRSFAVPKFMGNAFSSPKYLPLLFLFPILVISALVLLTNGIVHGFDMNFFIIREDVMKYEDFIHKLIIEALFIPGNVFIFILAGIGLVSYWKALNENNIKKPKKSFITALFEVAFDFFRHKNFDKCPTNSNRRNGHIYVFYGFVGTMIATGLVVVGEVHHYGARFHSDLFQAISFHLPYPMDFMHPVKLFGLASGLFLLIGLLLLIIKRIKQSEKDGKNTYQDWLFLWVIFSVALTGMMVVFLRMSSAVTLGYSVYFIHLVLVFFLLWYMPFSKFAHMPYRMLGLIYLKMHGRENKPEFFGKN